MSVDDLEPDDAQAILSTAVGLGDPLALSRRRFLQAAVAAAAGAAVPLLRPRDAGAAEAVSPIGAGDGVLVLVFLGGGNDGLNTVAPISGPARTTYDRLRGGLAIPAGQLLPLGTSGWGLHPGLGNLSRRFRRGRVAVVQGVGLPVADLSHFTATASMMRGQVASSGGGWLGRYLDGLPDSPGGLRGLNVGTSVPLFLSGERAHVTTVPSSGQMWGADRSNPIDAAVIDAVSSFAAAPSALGHYGDRVAATGQGAIAHAQQVQGVFSPDPGTAGPVRDLTLAARLINLDVGARVVGVTVGGFDTHSAQAGLHDGLLRGLDAAIEAFFATLSSRFQRRVTMLVQSEFGRRVHVNGALGTDHGRAAPMLVVGENVRGGLHGAAPDLNRLDDRGNLVPTVDFRSVYEQLLDGWLRADARRLLAGRFDGLGLFAAGPGGARPTA